MTKTHIEWLSLLVILIEFSSFWLLAPEIVGEEKVAQFVSYAIKAIGSGLLFVFIWIIGYLLFMWVKTEIMLVPLSRSIGCSEKTAAGVLSFLVSLISLPFRFSVKFVFEWMAQKIDKGVFVPFKDWLSGEGRKRRLLVLGAILFNISFGLKLLLWHYEPPSNISPDSPSVESKKP